jgi:hypothetical protein
MSATNDGNRRVSRGSRGPIEQTQRAFSVPSPSFAVGSGDRVSNRGDVPRPAETGGAADRGEIAGVVLGRDNVPVEEATVAISGGMRHKDIAALTDEGGRFRLTDLLPGDYSVTAHAAGHTPRTRQVRVGAGGASTITIALDES